MQQFKTKMLKGSLALLAFLVGAHHPVFVQASSAQESPWQALFLAEESRVTPLPRTFSAPMEQRGTAAKPLPSKPSGFIFFPESIRDSSRQKFDSRTTSTTSEQPGFRFFSETASPQPKKSLEVVKLSEKTEPLVSPEITSVLTTPEPKSLSSIPEKAPDPEILTKTDPGTVDDDSASRKPGAQDKAGTAPPLRPLPTHSTEKPRIRPASQSDEKESHWQELFVENEFELIPPNKNQNPKAVKPDPIVAADSPSSAKPDSMASNEKSPTPKPDTTDNMASSGPGESEIANALPLSEEVSLWKLLSQAEQQLSSRMETDIGMASVNKILGSACTPPDKQQILAVTQQHQADILQEKTGLEVRGAYTMGDFTDDPGDANAYLELSWDVLKNGYQENKARASALRQKARTTELRASVLRERRSPRCRRAYIADHFTALYAELLQMQLRLMEPVHAIERRAYFKGWSFFQDYLVSEEDIRLLQREIQYLHNKPESQDASADLMNPPVIDIDMPGVIAAIRNDIRSLQLNSLEKKDVSERNIARFHNRLRIFLRKTFEVGGRAGRQNRDGVGLGLRFQIPLEKQTNNLDHLKVQQIDGAQSVQEWERVAKARSAYVALREETARQIKLSYRYERARERVRQVFVRKNLGDDDLLTVAVTRVQKLLSTAVAILRSKVKLYHQANDIFIAAGLDYRPELVRISLPDRTAHRARLGDRAIYLWSESFNNIPNQQIVDFLEAKQIETVLLSAGSRTEREKLEAFSILADREKRALSLIIGANNWIFPQHHRRAVATIASTAELTGRVHLDIEPHTLEGYRKDHPNTFLDNYVELLRQSRDILGDRHMSVSVPVHWSMETYEKVGQLADTVYIMSYGSEKSDTIIRRLKPVLGSLPSEKAVVVLRVDDFEDEWAMEGAMEQIYARTGIHRFAIHQFKTFLKKTGIHS